MTDGMQRVCGIIEEHGMECRDEAREAAGDYGTLAEYASALRAEAALPERAEGWPRWAHAKADKIDAVARELERVLTEEMPD